MNTPSEKCILIVEDNEDLRTLYKQVLNLEGYGVLEAENGQAALDLLRSNEPAPCLIVLDLMMPVLDGWEFLRERASDPTLSAIPVVVCSAARDKIPTETRFIQKPIDLDALLSVAEEFSRSS